MYLQFGGSLMLQRFADCDTKIIIAKSSQYLTQF